jgi:hypothetical protein
MSQGLESDCASDPSLLAHLDESRSNLKMFYEQNYANHYRSTRLHPSQSLSSVSSHSSIGGSPDRVNFMSWYQMHDRITIDEFDKFMKLPHKDFYCCKPLQWWLGRCLQFPNLYQLACDLLSIPGKLSLLYYDTLN